MQPPTVRLSYLLNDLKQTCSSGNAVCLEGGGHCQTDRLVGSAFLTTEEARADGFYQWAATESSPADYVYGPFEGTTDGWYLRNDFVSGLAKELTGADRPPAGLFEPWTAQLRKRLMAKGEGAAVALSFGQAAGRVPYARVADVVRALSA